MNKHLKTFLALTLVVVSVFAIAAPALASGIEDYLGTSTLYYREDNLMMGQKVRNLQHMLNTLGYSVGTVDGKFGEKTHNAVCKFQRVYGLEEDGKVGRDTRATIYMALGYEIPSNCKKL